jgi:hypothetical protein
MNGWIGGAVNYSQFHHITKMVNSLELSAPTHGRWSNSAWATHKEEYKGWIGERKVSSPSPISAQVARAVNFLQHKERRMDGVRSAQSSSTEQSGEFIAPMYAPITDQNYCWLSMFFSLFYRSWNTLG